MNYTKLTMILFLLVLFAILFLLYIHYLPSIETLVTNYPQVQATIYGASHDTPPSLIPSNPSNNFTRDSSNNIMHYDPTNYNMTYHQVVPENEFYDISLNSVPMTYYTPGSYPYGAGQYVPSYEDSIYLSKATGLSTVTPLTDTPAMLAGFCFQDAGFPDKIERKCNALSKDVCSSTSCCVLLGGAKCVAGGEQGPTFKADYSDVLIPNRDFYYYQSKCYGNCGIHPEAGAITTFTPKPTITQTPSPSPSPTPTLSPTLSPTPNPTQTLSPSPTASANLPTSPPIDTIPITLATPTISVKQTIPKTIVTLSNPIAK